MPARRVIFVNRYFHPDHSATSQLLSDLAFHLAARGWEVEVVTSRQRYDDPRAMLARHEVADGVRITRVATTRFGRALLPARAIDYATFYVSAFFALLAKARTGTVVVALTDPPLISVIAALVCTLRRARLVNWVQDVFPEVAVGIGMRGRRGLALVRGLRDWSLRMARRNVVLGERMAGRLPTPSVVQHNWALDSVSPVPADANPLRNEWGLGDRFVVGYSGNLGRVHEFATITAAMPELPDVTFLIIGAGAQLEAVQRETRHLPNVQFRPYQPRERLSESLSSADVHLISLQPQLEGLVMPSKFYGVLAAARPAIFIGDAEGEVARLIRANDCGFVVAPGDAGALAVAIRTLSADRSRCEAMGRRGRELHEARFAPAIALRGWERILTEVSDA
jgi:glycosyltransferase involved in cell wall biosynthesis